MMMRLMLSINAVLFGLFAVAEAQYDVQYFIEKAQVTSPALHSLQNQLKSNKLEGQRLDAENSAFKASLTADYLFAPFLNNGGSLISANPDPAAVGYDVGVTNGGLYSLQLNLEKPVFNFAASRAVEKSIHAEDKIAEHGLNMEHHALVKQVTDLFLAAQQAQQWLELSEDMLARLNDQTKISAALMKSGLLKQTDFLLLQIELQNQLIQQRQLQSDLQANLNALFSYCGMQDTSSVRLTPIAHIAEQESDETQFIKAYQFDSLKIVAAQDLFESKYAPQVKVFLNTGLNAVEWENISRKVGMSAGFNFSLPLYDGGQRSLAREQQTLLLENIEWNKYYFLLQRSNQEKTLKKQIQVQKENLVLMEKQLAEFKDLLDISARNMQRGNLLMVEYLALLKNYADLRKAEISSRNNYLQLVNNYNYWRW